MNGKILFNKVDDMKLINQFNNYLKEPYSRVIIPDPDSGTFTAQILEFPGCIAQGDTLEEAYAQLELVAASWIQTALDQGQEIPAPYVNHEYSGRIALRIPRSLHQQVTLAAERDDTSINQYIVMAISEKIGASNFCERLVEELNQRKIKLFHLIADN
jgi:predicted RNase H-like HicB family nuclease